MAHILRLTGKESMRKALPPNWNLSNFTLQGWLKTETSGPLFEHHHPEKGTVFSVAITEFGKIRCLFGSKDKVQAVETVQGGINSGKWHCVLLAVGEGRLVLSVDGIARSLVPCEKGKTPDATFAGLAIGASLADAAPGFVGELCGIRMWDSALSEEALAQSPGLDLVGETLLSTAEKEGTLRAIDGQILNPRQRVWIAVENGTPYLLKKTVDIPPLYQNLVHVSAPRTIGPGEKANIKVTTLADFVFALKVSYKADVPAQTFVNFKIVASPLPIVSQVSATTSPNLAQDISVLNDTNGTLKVKALVSQDLTIIHAENLAKFLKEIQEKSIDPGQIVTNMSYDPADRSLSTDVAQVIRYNQSCQVFNTRIQEKPLAIVYCKTAENVQDTFLAAKKHNLPIRVRSGGHDHEGECTGTNCILIDMMGLDQFEIQGDMAIVGPGNRFKVLTGKLAAEGRMIAHGTCATVSIPGFIMGGGWGPWTRTQGMCCESLVGVDLVLGDGSLVYLNNPSKGNLLWALKGGGGMSYGIVTRLYIQTFPLPVLPDFLIKFELEWNCYDQEQQLEKPENNTLDVLTCWEDVINDSKITRLIGTNLKINGKPEEGPFNYKTVRHNCVMYGYWQGNVASWKAFVKQYFTDKGVEPSQMTVLGYGGGLDMHYGDFLTSAWDRESHVNVQLKAEGKKGIPLPPDLDEPAPHKITSRLVDECGLGELGHEALLRSLTSPLILEGNRMKGLFNYVTLGAIAGPYYANKENRDQCAFPYSDKQFTIQYQTWWNVALEEKLKLQDNSVYTCINRALDWMEYARDVKIPNTSGAFISFKDSSIPTSTYFDKNYASLMEIKEKHALDPFNHFRSRKTII